MKFKDIFEKYINGKASDEEIEIVENEIEKVELINDYLVEKIDDELIKKTIKSNIKYEVKNSNDINTNNKIKNNNVIEDDILIQIKKTINRKLVKVGIISVSVTICLLLSLKFIVSPIMNQIYYNPEENIDEFTRKIDVDLELASELHFPGVSNMLLDYEALGFGKYDISIKAQNYFESDDRIYNGRLDKNNFKIDDTFYQFPYKSAFSRDMIPFYQYPTDNDEEVIKELEKLPEHVNVKANISFSKDLDMSQVLELMKSNDIDIYWVAIRGCNVDLQRFPHIGMVPGGTGILLPKDKFDADKYPYLDLGWIEEKNIGKKELEDHFINMLEYMSDNEEFGKTDILFKNSNMYYKEVLDYINKNGVMSYGIVVSGKPKDILELRKNPLVECVDVSDIKLSMLQ